MRKKTVSLRAAAMAVAGALVLGGCSGGGDSPSDYDTPQSRRLSGSAEITLPGNFGDAKPHEWNTITPDDYEVHGIDASRYQGEIDWNRARAAGVNFAWLKATEGGDYIDPTYHRNVEMARSAGVTVGAYHFYYFCRTPKEQANWFMDQVPRSRGDLPPVLDIEWNHQSRTCSRHPDGATVRSEIREFVRLVKRYYGAAPVIYTTPDFYAENDLGALDGYEFWLRSVAGHPSERYPGERWTFWQYTGTGTVPGITGIVDINAFAGDVQSWRRWRSARVQK